MTTSPARPARHSHVLPLVLTAVGCFVVGGVAGAAATYSVTASANDTAEAAPAVTSLEQVPETLRVEASCDGGPVWEQTAVVTPEAITFTVGSDATESFSKDAYQAARCVAIDTGLTSAFDDGELDAALTEWQESPGDVTRTWNGWTLVIREGEGGGSQVVFAPAA
ncbi:hypothetical protein ACQFYA_20780 [Promicromonospora sp. Marseille-Q5078]